MKMYFVVNAFIPNKKAYGIHIAKMCEAFIEQGIDLTLVIPRSRSSQRSMKEFYELRVDIPTVRLYGMPLYNRGKALFFLSSILFMCISTLYLLVQRVRGRGVIYSVDLSTFSFANLPLAGMPVYMEVHEAKPSNAASRFFFRRARGFIATNAETKRQITETFHIRSSAIVVEPNGFDPEIFKDLPSREEARASLGLSSNTRISMYVGRFYAWKGLGILIEAARLAAEIEWYAVGGTSEEFQKATGVDAIPTNLHIIGDVVLRGVPEWLVAADALLILGTKQNEQSYRHTAPMKVYEYLAAGRPVVASATPALKSFIEDGGVLWYEPDDARSLVDAVRRSSSENTHNSRVIVSSHTWAERAKRIRGFIQDQNVSNA